MSRLKNNPYRDVSPSVLFRALSGPSRSSAPGTPDLGRDTTLDRSIQYATEEEKHFGIDVANSARTLKAWCQELETWRPKNSRVDNQIDKVRRPFSSRATEEQSRNATRTSSGDRWAWLHTPEELATYYQQRVDEIKTELGGLDIEKQKAALLDTHQRYQRRSGSGAEIGSHHTHLTGLSALITAVILNSLPYHGQLLTLMDVWTTRLHVLSYVPGFLVRLQDMTEALLAAWRIIQSRDDTDGLDDDHEEHAYESTTWDRPTFASLQRDLTQQLATLGHQLDSMLDALENREDTLPDQWIDDVDGLEEGFASWGLSAEASVRQHEARRREVAEDEHARRELENKQSQTTDQSTNPPKVVPESSGLTTATSAHDPATTTPSPLRSAQSEVWWGSDIADGEDVPDTLASTSTAPTDTASPALALSTTENYTVFDDRDLPELAPPGPPNNDLAQLSETIPSIPEHKATGFPPTNDVNGYPSKRATLEKTLFLTTGITKGMHRRHSSRELQTGWQRGHKALHRRHSSREIAVEAASFASGFSMSEVRRIDIVKNTSDAVNQRNRSMTASAAGDVGPVVGPDHWTVERWKANKAASEMKYGPQPNKSPLTTLSPWMPSPPSSQGIEDLSDRHDSDDGRESEPLLATPHSLKAQLSNDDAQVPSIPDLSLDSLDTDPTTDDLVPTTLLSPAPEDRDFETPTRPRLAEPVFVSTDDQIERRIDHILHTLPTRINFNKKNGARAPSRLSSSAPNSKQSPRSSGLAPPNERSPTPALTLSRVDQPSLPTAKTKSNASSIRLYHLVQAGRSAPIKLFVRLVGEEGRVMVRVGGGWEDLEKYLREYSAHHSRAIVPDLRDLDAVAPSERRAFTVPAVVANRTTSNPASAEKPLAGRPISRLSKAPVSKDLGGLQVPKRSGGASVARSVSEVLPVTTLPARPVTPTQASITDLEDQSDDSPSPVLVHISAEKREWLNSIVAKAKRWKAEGGSAGPVSYTDQSTPMAHLGGTTRLFRDGDGMLRSID